MTDSQKEGPDFTEIAHSGGTVTVKVEDADTGRMVSLALRLTRANAFVAFPLYVLPPGIPVETISALGMGRPIPPPSVPGSVMAYISSDREGWFGRECGWCGLYWRSPEIPSAEGGFCPYCGKQPEGELVLTAAQNVYIREYIRHFESAVKSGPGEYVIDMDAVADAVGTAGEKPPFYYTEVRQQTRIRCDVCQRKQDILGNRGYCCVCGTRNDVRILKSALEKARQRALDGDASHALRDAASAWDSHVAAVVGEITSRMPMTKSRRAWWARRPEHDVCRTIERLDQDFGFTLGKAVKTTELVGLSNMFERRHVHEHNGGIVDQRYREKTGSSEPLGSLLREAPVDVVEFGNRLGKLAATLHAGFHELFPIDQAAVERALRHIRP